MRAGVFLFWGKTISPLCLALLPPKLPFLHYNELGLGLYWLGWTFTDSIKSNLLFPFAAALLSLSVRLADSPTAIASAGPEGASAGAYRLATCICMARASLTAATR